MIGQFFHACHCYEHYRNEVIEVAEDWSEDAAHYLQTHVQLIWNTATDEIPCLENYSGNLHLPTGSPYHEQLVILLREQLYKQTFVNRVDSSLGASTGSIFHQSTIIGSYYDFTDATDDVLKNLIAVLDFDEAAGVWKGEGSVPAGSGGNWEFDFHPDFGLRYWFDEDEMVKVKIYPASQSDDIILGRYQLDSDCNSIGELSEIPLPEFMRNRPKSYKLILPDPITFTGTIDETEYENETVMSAGEYSFINNCIDRIECEGSFGGIQFVNGDCLCEPHKFDNGIYYYLPSAGCNDPEAVSISHGLIQIGESDTLSLYFGGDQGWTGNQFAYSDWKVKTGTHIDFYGDTTITPKLNESSSSLTLPAEAIIRFNGFGVD